MMHLIEQKENKKRLLIDPLSKFNSAINKDLIDYQRHLDSQPQKDLPLAPILSQQQTIPNLSSKPKNIKFGILDANFNDLLRFSQVGGDQQKGKNRAEKSLKKEIIQAPNHRVQKSITLPKLSSSNLRLSKANLPMGQETLMGCTLLSEMIDKLEQSNLLTFHGDKICTDKNTLHQLLSYAMCLALADKKSEVCNLKYTYQQFANLDTIAQKIFFKIREKKMNRKKPKLKIYPLTAISFQYVPAACQKKKKLRVKTQLSPQKIDQDSSGSQTKRAIRSRERDSDSVNQHLLQQFERAKELYSNVKTSLQEYTEILSSGDLKVKLGEMYPLEQIQKELTSEIKVYYLTTFHDPMLVPDLKERLLTNLIVKVLNNFKFSIYDFSQTAERKCRSVSLIVEQIRNWIQKHQLKQEYLARMKKLFIIDITLFFRKVTHLNNRLKRLSFDNRLTAGQNEQIERSKLQELRRFGEQMVEFCRSVSQKYRNEQFLFNQ